MRITTSSVMRKISPLCDNAVGDFPLLEQYLSHIHSDEKAPHIHEVVTGGLFETQYPLGHGQMAAIQAINQDERLIAVQGAPGTGKTTLFKSLIAQQLVARALAIADGKRPELRHAGHVHCNKSGGEYH